MLRKVLKHSDRNGTLWRSFIRRIGEKGRGDGHPYTKKFLAFKIQNTLWGVLGKFGRESHILILECSINLKVLKVFINTLQTTNVFSYNDIN